MYPRTWQHHRAPRRRSRARSDDSALATAQHSNLEALERCHKYHQGQGKSSCGERHRGAIFASSEEKLRPDLIFFDKGRIPLSACYLSNSYISQPSWSQRVSEWQREASLSDLWQQLKADTPKGETTITPSWPQGRLEMPVREQGSHNTSVAFLLHRSFSI